MRRTTAQEGRPARWVGPTTPGQVGFRPTTEGETGRVTAPQSWIPSPSTAPPLVVRPDRAKARGWLTIVLVINGGLAAVCLPLAMWASSGSLGIFGGAAFAITLTGSVFQMVLHAFTYGRLLGADVIAEIGPGGLRGPSTRWELVSLPWSSIASVTKSWNAVVVQPVPGAGEKLVIPTRATTADTTAIRAAVSHFSGGRF